MKVKIYEVRNRPLTITEVNKDSGFELTEKEVEQRVGKCACGSSNWILIPVWSKMVREGGKRYLRCVDCGASGNL